MGTEGTLEQTKGKLKYPRKKTKFFGGEMRSWKNKKKSKKRNTL